MNRKGFAPLIVIGIIAAIVVVGAIGYFLWRHSIGSEPPTQIQQNSPSQGQQTSSSPSQVTNTMISSSSVPASTTTWVVEPLSYAASNTLFSVTKQLVPVSNIFTSTDLRDNCAGHPQSYYDGLSQKYSAGDTAMQYTFHYIGATWDPVDYAVTVLPNKLGYKTLADFKKDFDLCATGDEFYPSAVNDRYLLFVPTYTQGDGDNASGLPDGRDLVGSFVEPTLKLN